tara:strand:+ start:59953 stop:60522 length:570 start_codon:yes stop_codon:yes gene_type:complete
MMCIRVRWHVSNLEGADPSARASRHLEGCQQCATFHTRLANLEGSLKASRLTAPHPAPAASRQPLRLPLALAGAAAIAVAVVVYVQLGAGGGSSTDSSSHNPALATSSIDAGLRAPSQVGLIDEGRTDEGTLSKSLEGAQATVLSQVRKLGELEDPLALELAAWRSDSLRGIESIRSLGRTPNRDMLDP